MRTKRNLLILVAVLALTSKANVQAQEMNPPYLSQFPSVERVKAEIKGSGPIDTAAPATSILAAQSNDSRLSRSTI